VVAATRAGVAQCLRFGVITVGDITRHPHLTRRVLSESQLRATSFGEVTAMGPRRHLLEPRIAAALAPSPVPGRVMSAVSPHAPYSIEPAGYARCLAAARAAGAPITTHMAESPDEAAFLADHSGSFRRLWDAIGGLDGAVPTFAGGPVKLAADCGLLGYAKVSLAHVNYVDDTDLDLLEAGGASVVYCPRTHAYFGHPPHPWLRMLGRGINVAVGTDSAASSPNLNLVDDLRLLHRLSPETPAETLWQMATTRAARAIGLAGTVGGLGPGMAADLVAFPVTGPEPLTEVLESGVEPVGVWVAGTRAGKSLFKLPPG
jgi:cytosine/adenosine deaminase-related metal-dependent hydrolase